jgi:transcriptional regulator with XRE-family HTH domain
MKTMCITKQMAAKMRAKREAKNMTQQELAEAVGVHRVTINRLENGKQVDLPASKMDRIASTLGMTITIK